MPLLGIGAVDLIGFLVALAAILAVGALWVLFQPLSSLLRAVPLVGGQIADAIDSGLKLAMQSVIAAYDALAHDSAHFLYTIGMGMWHLVYNVTQGITKALGLANQAAQAAGSVAAQLPVDISGAISSANSYADGVGATVLGEADNLFNESISHADNLYNEAVGVAQGLATQVEVHADGLFDTAEADINTVLGETTTYAQDLYNQAVQHADSLFNAATADINTALGDATTYAQDLYNQAVNDLTGEIDALGVAGIAGTVAGLLTQVATISTEVDTCLEPLCDTVTPNANELGQLGSLLNGIDGLIDAALLTGLLSAAVADPKAAASAVVDTGGWLSTLGVDAANAFGVVV